MKIRFNAKDKWEDVRMVLQLLMDGRFISSWSHDGADGMVDVGIKDPADLQFILRLLRGHIETVEVSTRWI